MSKKKKSSVRRTGNPHDDFFFEVFAEPSRAAAFFRQYLPEPIVQVLDLEHATLCESSFKKTVGENRFADMLYQIPYHDPVYNESIVLPYLYIIWEHQSSPTPMMCFRFLGYTFSMWQKLMKEQGEKGAHKLPMILPLCFYHGEKGWTASTDLFDWVDLPAPLKELFRPYALSQRHLLIQTQAMDDARIDAIEDVVTRLAIRLFKAARSPHLDASLLRKLEDWRQLRQRPAGMEWTIRMFSYVIQVNPHLTAQKAQDVLDQILDNLDQGGKSIMPTLTEQWTQEGHKRGIAEGITKGKAEGKAEVALNMLKSGLSVDQVILLTGLTLKDVLKIKEDHSL